MDQPPEFWARLAAAASCVFRKSESKHLWMPTLEAGISES